MHLQNGVRKIVSRSVSGFGLGLALEFGLGGGGGGGGGEFLGGVGGNFPRGNFS